ncbi:MAG: sulfite exporter TauE/SafE family protein, partial [Coriobacteriales bacterium]
AKITSYVLVGLLLGAIGSALDLGGVRGWVTVAAGLFMVLLGLQMTGRFPVLHRLTPGAPKALVKALGSLRKKAVADEGAGRVTLATPVMFGLVTGLMPCGPLQSAQLAAAGSGAPLSGAVAMLGFGLGTMPLMLGFGAVSGALSATFKRKMMTVAAVLVALLGLVMLDRGLVLVGSPVTASTVRAALSGMTAPGDGGTATGGQDVQLVVEGVRFVPREVHIPADTPVRLVVERREDDPCSEVLAVPQLGVRVDLAPYATTVVEIPATRAGVYTLTCGMGMMDGTLIVDSLREGVGPLDQGDSNDDR